VIQNAVTETRTALAANPRTAARANYDRLSRWYDLVSGSEQRFVRKALCMLRAQPGERVLEIGPGTGHGLVALAQLAGPFGHVIGLDLSPGMLAVAGRRVARADLGERVCLTCADAARLPLISSSFDALFLSFTLELFAMHEIPVVLEECYRALRPRGRVCVVALSGIGGSRTMLRLYEWAHTRYPTWIDCRPILPEKVLRTSGFEILQTLSGVMWGLPVEIVLAAKPGAQSD
jgi:ubiquinone/menaquinone biosynthesis C-methylase UbiE